MVVWVCGCQCIWLFTFMTLWLAGSCGLLLLPGIMREYRWPVKRLKFKTGGLVSTEHLSLSQHRKVEKS